MKLADNKKCVSVQNIENRLAQKYKKYAVSASQGKIKIAEG